MEKTHSFPASAVSDIHSLSPLFEENFSYNDNDSKDKNLKPLRFKSFFLSQDRAKGLPSSGSLNLYYNLVCQVWHMKLEEVE